MTGYAELQVTTKHSFLRGTSHIEELFAQAAAFGLSALGITDRNTVAQAETLSAGSPTGPGIPRVGIKVPTPGFR